MFEISSSRQAMFHQRTTARGWLAGGLICLAAAFAGCAEEADDLASVPVGVSQDALSGLIIAGWGGVSNGSPKFTNGSSIVLPLGVGNGWVCWLSGVRGAIGSLGHVNVFQADSQGDPPDNVQPNEWALVVESASGLAAFGNAVCAPAANLGTSLFGIDSPTLLTGANANEWCGLSALNAFPGPPQSWSRSSDFATVSNNGSNPQVSGGAPTWTLSASTTENSEATCAQASVSGIWTYHIIAPSSGSGSFNMLQNNGTQLPSGTVCFLTNLQGAFVNSGFTDGVFVDRSSSGMWSMTASNGKSGWALCIL